MYPFLRMFWQLFKYRNGPALPAMGEHRSEHYCMPWDIDLWCELNNGRTLTLYDLGRIPLGQRTGLFKILKQQGWGITVAGVSVRYRRRIRAFEKVSMRSRMVGWDERFLYLEQSLWKKNGECANHILLRMAVTSAQGLVMTDALGLASDPQIAQPALPPWVQAWIDADAKRPWPPMPEVDMQE